MYLHIRGEADAVSPMVVFAVFGSCCALRFRGAVGRRKRQPFPFLKRAWRATCASGGSMDGRRFGRAPKSAAFSRGGRPEMAGSMSEAALGTFCCAHCTRNRPLGRAFPVRIVNGFHPPKVPNLFSRMGKSRTRRIRQSSSIKSDSATLSAFIRRQLNKENSKRHVFKTAVKEKSFLPLDASKPNFSGKSVSIA